jgi:hypothetical protein
MKDVLIFLCGFLCCFLTISIVAGISYRGAVILGRGIGLCEGVLLASKLLFKKCAADKRSHGQQSGQSA